MINSPNNNTTIQVTKDTVTYTGNKKITYCGRNICTQENVVPFLVINIIGLISATLGYAIAYSNNETPKNSAVNSTIDNACKIAAGATFGLMTVFVSCSFKCIKRWSEE
jgi:hypothetical protein